MADKKITINATPSKVKTISVNKATVANEITATPDTSLYYSNLSKQWATKLDGKVVGEDYSSKYYAENAKISAETAKMEASTVNSLVPQLQDNFNIYNSTLNETASNATEEINVNRDYAITQVNQTATQAIANVNTTKTEAISTIENKANGLADIDLSNLSETGLAFLKENSGGGGSGFSLFDTRTLDYELQFEQSEGWALQGTYVYKEGVAGSRYGYPDFYAECVSQKENATATETTLGNNTITMYINGNGHQFYDIADKDVVDNFYNSVGVAWFYGIDTENERVFLPRSNFFAVTGGVMGNGIALGLTDGTNNFGLDGGSVSSANGVTYGVLNAYGVTVGSACGGDNPNKSVAYGLTTDPTKSGITLEPDESKYLYICVGNSNVQKAVTNITEITTSENDTLPLFHNFYSQEDMTTTGAYVNASLGTFLDGNIYKTAYNELVKKLGTDNVKSITDEYTDYDFVINQDEMTFRLPLLNGEESIISGKTENLTLLATGSDYIAPANGWFYIMKIGKSGEKLELVNKTNNIDLVERSRATSEGMSLIMEAKRNDSVLCSYTASGNLVDFKFIYAQGDGNLYYKVANAVENLEILDVGKVMKEAVLRSSLVEADSHFSGVSMPSDKYIEMAFGASETTYTAPANGYFQAFWTASGANQYLTIKNTNNDFASTSFSVANSNTVRCWLPVRKNDVVKIGYNVGTKNSLRFYYAEGEV